MRRTKIICTLGPASATHQAVARLARTGMDVARLNLSHGTYDQHRKAMEAVRSASRIVGRRVGTLLDLQGPKLRLGELDEPIIIRPGQSIQLSDTPQAGCIPLPHPELLAACRPGQWLLLDDGRIRLRVVKCSRQVVTAEAERAGVIQSRKGISAPGIGSGLSSITPKDEADLRFGLEAGVDWIAVSFVRRAKDLDRVKQIMAELDIHRPIVAKIEKGEAIDHFESILTASDGIMVARGDLGVETDLYQVPFVQKQIVAQCNAAGKPVIVATQMLESMIHSSTPTRAEVNDVANAILDGADAVMLSGETAVGQFPAEAVRTMREVAEQADRRMGAYRLSETRDRQVGANTLGQSAVRLAADLRARAILCATTSGSTARMIAKHRPKCPIYAVTPSQQTVATLSLTWGVKPLQISPVASTDEMMASAVQSALRARAVKAGDIVILTAGVPVNIPGNTNLIRVHRVGDPL